MDVWSSNMCWNSLISHSVVVRSLENHLNILPLENEKKKKKDLPDWAVKYDKVKAIYTL